MGKFKVGDKVRVRKDLEIGKVYNRLELLREMYQHHDIMTINCEDNGQYRCKENDFWWGEDMLEKIDNDELTLHEFLEMFNLDNISAIVLDNDESKCYFGIRRSIEFYERFIMAFGDLIVKKVKIEKTDKNMNIMKIMV